MYVRNDGIDKTDAISGKHSYFIDNNFYLEIILEADELDYEKFMYYYIYLLYKRVV